MRLRHVEHFYDEMDHFMVVLDTHLVRLTHEQTSEMVLQYLDRRRTSLVTYSGDKPVRQVTCSS